ncbi:MAG: transaldolase family protein [Candidatus Woesearchaeota archaeon]
MHIYLDSADKELIKKSAKRIDGVTTNPSLLKQSVSNVQQPLHEYVHDIFEIMQKKPVSLEVAGGSSMEMYKQAKALYRRFSSIRHHVVIKIPINMYHQEHHASLEVIHALAKEKIPTNVTLIFTPEQALIAAKAGATYVSPFVGRMDDFLRKRHGIQFNKNDYYPSFGWKEHGYTLEDNGVISGVHLVEQIAKIYTIHKYTTKIIAASLRHVRQIRECALAGAHIATISYELLSAMEHHELTQKGNDAFIHDTIEEYKALMNDEARIQY